MGTIQQVKHSRTRSYQRYLRPFSETAVPYAEFKRASFEIDFVTEKGNMPECDSKMLEGMTQKLLVWYKTNLEIGYAFLYFLLTGCYARGR